MIDEQKPDYLDLTEKRREKKGMKKKEIIRGHKKSSMKISGD